MKKLLLTVMSFGALGTAMAQDTLTSHFNLVTSTPTVYSTTDGGYVSGTNEYGDLAKLQLFDATYGVTNSGSITSILLWAPVKAGTGSFQVAVWADNNGTPNPAPLGVVNMTLASVDTTSSAIMVANGDALYNVAANFSSAIAIPAGNKFWAGVILPTGANDTLALVSSTDGDFDDADTHAGEFWDTGAFHTFGDPANWGLDIALAIYPVVNFVAGVDENVINASVYPNPANSVLNVTASEAVASVTIVTMDGKVVATSNGASVNVADLNAGMYIYTVTTVTGKTANGTFAKN
jgi:hypothetical protein